MPPTFAAQGTVGNFAELGHKSPEQFRFGIAIAAAPLLEQQCDLFRLGGHLIPSGQGLSSSVVILRLKLMNAKRSRTMRTMTLGQTQCVEGVCVVRSVLWLGFHLVWRSLPFLSARESGCKHSLQDE